MDKFVSRKRKTAENADEESNAEPVAKTSASELDVTGTIVGRLTDPGWKKALAAEFKKPYFSGIVKGLEADKKAGVQVMPPEEAIFAAFNLTPLEKTKIVIIGQDPYHDIGQAHGLCFSVQKGVNPPPSLKNIYKELTTDIKGFKTPSHGNLEKWAKDGILLLNATLTVQAHTPNSHKDLGWQTFTDAVIQVLNKERKGVVFILWGGFAIKKGKSIDRNKHKVITAAHPSPLSATKFFGCKVFSECNKLLKELGEEEFDWSLPEKI